MMIQDKLKEIRYNVEDICGSIFSLAAHIDNRCGALERLWRHISRDKTFGEIEADIEALKYKLEVLNRLIMGELKCLVERCSNDPLQ